MEVILIMIFVKVVVIRLFVRIHNVAETDFSFGHFSFSVQSPFFHIFFTFSFPEFELKLFSDLLENWDFYQKYRLGSPSDLKVTTHFEKLVTLKPSSSLSKD